MPGENISASEVTGVSAIGLWLLADDREYFVPFADYPDFLRATVEQIYRLENPSPTQFYWPDLDIDIDLNALEEPERFPLAFKP
jgi:hypothetical protein